MKVVKMEENSSKGFVIKSNSLIEARYRLSLQESRVIFWLLDQIKPDDEDFKPYQLDIKQFSKIVSLKSDGQYGQLKKITKNLTKRSLDIYEPIKKTLLQASWLSAAFYEFSKGYVVLEFSPHLKPYLLQIKSHFTKIETSHLLQLKSIYSIRIFELLKQYEEIGKRKITIEELRTYCGIKSGEYRNYNAVKLYVIERAATEINAKTDYEIDCTEIKESRKVAAIEWTIKKKNLQKEEHSQKLITLQKELRSELALIEALMEYGFSKGIAKRFLKTNEEEVIKNALKSVNLQIERGNVKNPKAMLQTAIKEKWHPEVFKKKKRSI
jgi:plasmid replication initiation protein